MLTCKKLDHSLQLLAVSVDVKHQIHDLQHQYKLQQPQAETTESISNSHLPGKQREIRV